MLVREPDFVAVEAVLRAEHLPCNRRLCLDCANASEGLFAYAYRGEREVPTGLHRVEGH